MKKLNGKNEWISLGTRSCRGGEILGSAPGLPFYLRILWKDGEALLEKTEVGFWLLFIYLSGKKLIISKGTGVVPAG